MLVRAFVLLVFACTLASLSHAQAPRPVGAPLATVYVTLAASTGTTIAVAADEAHGTFHTSDNGSAVEVDLPDALEGMSLCVYDLNGTSTITVDPFGTEQIRLHGTLVAAGDTIDNSTGGAGDYICFLANTATTWLSLGESGTWQDTP